MEKTSVHDLDVEMFTILNALECNAYFFVDPLPPRFSCFLVIQIGEESIGQSHWIHS